MPNQNNIVIKDNFAEYTFVVSLEEKRVDLITEKLNGTTVESIVSLNRVPDRVQIKFYQLLRKLQHESTGSSTNDNK